MNRTHVVRVIALCGAITLAGCDQVSIDGFDAVDEWAMLGHDYRSSYTNPAQTKLSRENAHQLGSLWEFEARGLVYGTPVVVDGTVFITSTGGLYAFEADTGRLRWQILDFGATSSLAYDEGMIFVHDLGAFLHALDASTGTEKWRIRTDTHALAAGTSSPIVFEDYVIVGLSSNEIVRAGATFRGGVAAFDKNTGRQLWRDYTANPPHNGASVWSTVSIDTEARVVFAGTGQNYTEEAGPDSDAIIALDLDTGARLWTRQTVAGDVFTPINPRGPDADFGANPILLETEINGQLRRLVVDGQKNGMFWALDRKTGEVVWQRKLGPGSPLTGGVLNNGAFDGERILVANNSGGHGVLFALRPSDGEILWQRDLPGWVWAPITVANHVGIVASDKDLHAFDVETGEDLFVFPTDGTIACGASIVDGRVYFGSGMAHIVGTRNRKFHVLALPDERAPGPEPSPARSPSGAPTFTAIYDEIFIAKGCNTLLCHGGGAGGLSMATRDAAYLGLVEAPSIGELCGGLDLVLVVPGDASASLLWDKISNRTPACGEPMPVTESLPAAQLEQIRRWIELGAAND